MITLKEILNINMFDLSGFIAITACIVSFISYWALNISSAGHGVSVIRARFAGFILMAVLPTGLLFAISDIRFEDIGLIPVQGSGMFMFLGSLILGISGVIVTVLLNPGSPKHFEKYPQIRDTRWTRSIFIWNIISWIVYLTGYEILFRGIVLFTIIGSNGVWTAVAVSTALYSALHLQKGFFEAIGAIPLGLLFSIVTIISGSVWIAVIVHVVMAISNTLWSLKHHPEMAFIK